MSDLKQLNFVDSQARGIQSFAESAYTSVKGYLPGILLSPVNYGEQVVAPYYGKAQSLAHTLLVNIDGKVDYGVTTGQSFYKVGTEKTRKVVGDAAADQFVDAKDKYVTVVSDTFQFVRAHGVVGTVSAAIDRRGEVVDTVKKTIGATTNAVYTSTVGAVDYVKEQPIAKKLYGIAEPWIGFGVATYQELREFIVKAPLYATLYNLVLGVYGGLTENSLAKTLLSWTKTHVYPRFAFAVDPVVDTATPYVKAVAKHIEPQTSSETSAEDVKSEVAGKTDEAAKEVKKTGKAAESKAKGVASDVEKKVE